MPRGKLLVPEELAHTLVSQAHQATHCLLGIPGIQLKGTLPLEHLGVDFTEMKPHGMYVLEVVKAFPTWTERASEVARCLLREIVPRFGFPTSIGSGNGQAFVADLVKTLNIKWIRETDCS